jgi:hypothetical protein
MRAAVGLACCLMASLPAAAQEAKPAEPDKPVTERTTTVGDAVATPVSDLNLKKDAIPALLIAAQERPYDTTGLRRCPQIAAAVNELNAVLGPDIDLPQDAKGRTSAGSVAQAAVGSFIPFRGLIREISGANASERKLGAAIQAGIARRSYLKGLGEARGCRYPARSAGPAEIAAAATPAKAEAKTAEQAKAAAPAKPARPQPGKRSKGVHFVSEPVVQETGKK